MSEQQSTKPVVKLTGENGNIFNLVGKATQALKKAGENENAEYLQSQLFECGSYDEALNLISEYCEIE